MLTEIYGDEHSTSSVQVHKVFLSGTKDYVNLRNLVGPSLTKPKNLKRIKKIVRNG